VNETTSNIHKSPRVPEVNLFDFFTKYFIQSLLIIVAVALGLINPYFRSATNLQNILLQASFSGIGAAGMTLLIVSGAFDLSVAGLLGLCGVILAKLIPDIGVGLAIAASLVIGFLLGLVNGLVVSKLQIPAFIATLGMMNIYLALAFIWTGGQVITVSDQTFQFLGTGTLFGVLPVPFVVMIVIYLLCRGILDRTLLGRYLRAVGSNAIAGRTAGLPVDRVRILAFAIVGVCTAVAGIFLTAELSSANAIMASGYELTVIAVVVIGGTSLKGGKGTLLGSFAGALFFAVISNALNIFGVGAYWQYVVTGLFLIGALGVQALRSTVQTAE
jgi:ribose/xylose/arabinose/galactoside ABC-type transport system permease subunit